MRFLNLKGFTANAKVTVKVYSRNAIMCQGGLLTVILASRMTGNPQISGEISGENHALLMSRMGSGQIMRNLYPNGD